MTTESPRVRVGSEGWFDDPRGDFYPDDLPEDWRLSFYNTSFSCVLLDAAQLVDCDLEEVGQWQHDLQSQFRFLIAIHAHFNQQALASLKQRLLLLGPHLGGVIVRDSEYELAEVRPLVDSLVPEMPVFFSSDNARLWPSVFEHGFFPCWRSLEDLAPIEEGRHLLHGVLMVSPEAREPRQLRALLEATESRISQQGGFYLIYSEPQADAQIMHNGLTLCELLGIM